MRIFFAIISLMMSQVMLAGLSWGNVLNEAEQQDIYSQAKTFFRDALVQQDPQQAKALYEKALRRFERLVAEGNLRNGKLYYNIGNTYFRLNDLGRAILNYKRAEQFIPNDSNLQQNLKYARSRRLDNLEEKEQTKLLKTVLFWHYDLSAQTRSIIFAVCFAGFWLGASIRLFFRSFFPRWTLVSLFMLSLLFLCSLLAESLLMNQQKSGVVTAQEVTARKGDGAAYQPSFNESLHAGTEFDLIEQRNGWLQIELYDGRTCWIPEYSADLL